MDSQHPSGEAALTLCMASLSAHWMRTGTEELMCALYMTDEPCFYTVLICRLQQG